MPSRLRNLNWKLKPDGTDAEKKNEKK